MGFIYFSGDNQNVSERAKSVGKDNMCRKGQYVSEGAKCVGKKKIKKSLTVSLKGILWILFRHIV